MIDSSAAGRTATKHSAGEPEVSIIIPSKDKADLLSNCLRSLLAMRGPRFEIIVVDNGSVEPETEELYAQIQNRTDIKILRDPSPFNFARLCNLGARTARGSALLFLNNDTEVLHPAWLERMIHWSSQPDVGAVGAKLAYPSMRIQHAGLVLGLFGLVAHSDLGVGTRRGGYLGRLLYTREVSAVTGACLAVSRSKFAAVSGFDETAFPIDLNDIDLCLRLSQRGWKALMVNDALLIHHESASRGRTRHPEIKYRHEIANFRARWNCILHDDPYFHPALSLSSFNIRLG